jgi:polysaccharide export outer membrane protein
MGPTILRGAVMCLSAALILCAFVGVPSARSQTVETPQQTNERLKSLATTVQHNPPPVEYIIGSGDVIALQVFDVPEMSRDLRVGQTGTVGIPLVPVRLQVAGLTEAQTEKKIEEVLEANGLISHPEVSVVVKEKKSRPITIVGAVQHPMVYSADRQVTLIEVLAEAGGIASDAGDHVIVTRPEAPASDPNEPPAIAPEDTNSSTPRVETDPVASSTPAPAAPSSGADAPTGSTMGPGPQQGLQAEPPTLASSTGTSTITINLQQILETGDMSSNIVLLPGDVVTVPRAGIIYVLGAVQRPGGYTVTNDHAQLTTLKILSLAGGLNRTAKGSHAYVVRKDVAGKQTEVEVDLTKIMKFEAEDLQLRPSDILYVPNSAAKSAAFKAAEVALAVGTSLLLYRVAYQ